MKVKILVYEDDPAVLLSLDNILSEMNLEIIPAEIYGEFLTGLRKGPQVILIDYYLPDHDTGQLIADLKNNPKTAKIPVFLMSAKESVGHEAAHLGANGFIAKPFDITDLKQTLLSKY